MTARTGNEAEEQLIAEAVGELARRTRMPVAFGGLERAGAIHVTSVVGAKTRSLDGLVVQASRGLGGRALVEKRPRFALDYRSSPHITHDYDRAVLGEGIATLFAVPLIVRGKARGVLYCGSWASSSIGDVVARPAFGVADELATELQVREEVLRRLSYAPPSSVVDSRTMAPAAREELRQSFAELRSIASTVRDATLRQRLSKLEHRLTALSRDDLGSNDETHVHLSPREIDVLACVALGDTNAQIAVSLSLKEVTIKSYLQSAMSKLDATTRHAAVAKARRAGILP